MKISICLVIIASFGYVGYSISKNYYTRYKYLTDFKDFVKYSKLNIRYNTPDISKLVQGYNFKSCEFKNDITNYINNKDKNISFSELTDNELKILNEFFEHNGRYDKQNTLEFLDKIFSELDDIILTLKLDEKQKGVLPFKLSLIFGILLCIILI